MMRVYDFDMTHNQKCVCMYVPTYVLPKLNGDKCIESFN